MVGGAGRRQDSVWNGLTAVAAKPEIVAIQDAARPCTTAELRAALPLHACAKPAPRWPRQQVADTIKGETADGKLIAGTVDRAKLWSVQTPQTFRVEIIRRAITAARAKNLVLTDDTAACELIGQPVRLVRSTAPNPKVTVPADLPFIESLLRSAR